MMLVMMKEELIQVAPAKRGGGGRIVILVVRGSILAGELWRDVSPVLLVSTGRRDNESAVFTLVGVMRVMLVSPAALDGGGMETTAK